ncbi:MAG: beta-ketoacyl-[acyl-carrier-protein] synthase family protein [Nitriliruptoraceae bacterium]
MSDRDIVVTGFGVISPSGRGYDQAWQGVLAGVTAAATDEQLVAGGIPVTISCRVPSFDPDEELGRGTARRLDRFTHLALIAAREAVANAGLIGDDDPFRLEGVDAYRTGVILGSGIGGAETWQEEYPRFIEKGPGRTSPMFVPKMLSNTGAGSIAIRTGARGPNITVNTACAAGASAMHVARDLLRSGSADLMLAGGVEAGITGLSVAAFAQMGALSRNPDPATASRPFDVDRDGFVIGEGAGIAVLETRAHAHARGATPLAVLAGAGASADAHHVTAMPEDGGGAILAIRRALADADIDPADIGHLNAHGTSTPLNDVSEARALRAVFGDHTDNIVVTSTKGVTGHLLGAGGAVEAAFAVKALNEGLVPPTANLTNQDPDIALDVVAGAPRQVDLKAVLSTSMGFGGQNSALIFVPA